MTDMASLLNGCPGDRFFVSVIQVIHSHWGTLEMSIEDPVYAVQALKSASH